MNDTFDSNSSNGGQVPPPRAPACYSGRARAMTPGTWLAVLTLCACGGAFAPDSRDLGSTTDAVSTPSEDTSTYSIDSFIGTWIGEALDPLHPTPDGAAGVYQFPSGSSQIRLTLGAESAIVFGEGTPPPVEDLEVGYPIDTPYMQAPLSTSPLLPPLEGFAYELWTQNDHVVDASLFQLSSQDLRDGVIRLNYVQNEFVQEWCERQVPIANPVTLYGCAEWTTGFGTSGGTEGQNLSCSVLDGQPIDCGKMFLCISAPIPVCQCNVGYCYINRDLRPGLFLRRDGDELVGVLGQGIFHAADGLLTTLGEVRFRRAD